MRNLLVFLTGVLLLCSALVLFSKATWGEPIGIDALQPAQVQSHTAVQEELRAQRFVLVDENGTQAGMFGMVDGHVYLRLYDKKQKPRVEIGVDTSDQPGFVLLDENGKIRVLLHVEGNEPSLMLLDENGKPTSQLPQ